MGRGYLEDIDGSWQETWRTGSSWMSWMVFFTLRKIPRKFCVDILIRSMSGRGGQEGGTWRTLRVPDQRHGWQGHFWLHEWCSFTLRNIPWKLGDDISIRNVSGRGGSRRVVLGGHWGFQTSEMNDRAIPDVRNDVFYPKNHTHKVLGQYLYLLWSYKKSRSKWLTSVDKRRERQGEWS